MTCCSASSPVPDALDRLLAALGAYAPAGVDARTLADALWLAAARAAADDRSESAAGSSSSGLATPEPARADLPDPSSLPSSAAAPGPGVSIRSPESTTQVRGTPLSLGRADALPGALTVGRALHPFRRAWRRGSRTRLDIDATVDHYARGGPLIPLFSLQPERWFEVVVIVDTSPSMSVWEETTNALTRLLSGLGAFRTTHTWHLEWADAGPRLRDQLGTLVPVDRAPYHGSGAQGRRLILVVTDCTARGWHGPSPWQMLSAWGRQVTVTLVDPLPQRLWRRSALNLPAVRVTAARAGSRNSALRYRLPLRLQPRPGLFQELGPWQALPVATCTPHSLGTWARAVMNTDPQGCDAVLVPATGRLPRTTPDATTEPGGTTPEDLTDAFLRTASAPALRLAVLCSHLPELTLPLLHALREQAVPEAELADLAELLTSGLLSFTRVPGHDPVLSLRSAARTGLRAQLTSHDAWQTLLALSRHLDAHPHAPHGIAAVLHTPQAASELPAHLQPFARAAVATQRLLGIPVPPPLSGADRPEVGQVVGDASDPGRRPSANTGSVEVSAPTTPRGRPRADGPPVESGGSEAHPPSAAETEPQPPWPGAPSAARIVMIARTVKPVSAGSKFRHVGTGFLLGPRLILTAAQALEPRPSENSPTVLKVHNQHGRVTPDGWFDCRVVWKHDGYGAALLLTDADVADPATDDQFTTPRWTRLTGTAPLTSCHMTRLRLRDERELSDARGYWTSTGVLRPPSNSDHATYEFQLTSPMAGTAQAQSFATAVSGAPVFYSDLFMGFTVAPWQVESEKVSVPVLGLDALTHDQEFTDTLSRYLHQRPPALHGIGATPSVPVEQTTRFLIGSPPESWTGAPHRASALARDWELAESNRPIVLGGAAAAEKRSFAARRVRSEWDAGTVDLAIWVTGSDAAEIHAQYVEAEATIAGTAPVGVAEGVRALFRRLQAMTHPWIIVIDGLDELPLPDDVIPPLTFFGRIVVTGSGPRLRAWGTDGGRTPYARAGESGRPRGDLSPGHGPWYFYLSYARRDDRYDAYVGRLYRDLVEQLEVLGGRGAQPSFRDIERIGLSESWDREFGDAVGECRTLVALYSPAYFRSLYCGKEWAAFRARQQEYRRATEIDAPVLIPVLWSPTPVPREAESIQYMDSRLGTEYAEHGLLNLLRTDPTGEPYRRAVEGIAQRIHFAAERFGLPRAVIDFASVRGAFPDSESAPFEEQRAVGHVRLFVAAGGTGRPPAGDQSATSHGTSPLGWTPYAQPPRATIAHRAQRLIVGEGMTTSLEEVDRTLGEQLDEALRNNQASILIIDPWSIGDPTYRDALTRFDGGHHPATGVIIPWDSSSAEPEEELWAEVRSMFMRNWIRRDDRHDPLFRVRVDQENFDNVLTAMVTGIQNRLMEQGTPQRLPPGPAAPPMPGLRNPVPRPKSPHDE